MTRTPKRPIVDVAEVRSPEHAKEVAFRFPGDGDHDTDLLTFGSPQHRARAIAAHRREIARPGDLPLAHRRSGQPEFPILAALLARCTS